MWSSPAASRWFPMVLSDTASAICARSSSLDTVRAATAARTMRRSWRASLLRVRPEPGVRGGKIPHTTAENSDTPPIHCIQHVWHPSIWPSSFPQAYNATPFKWLNYDNRCKIHGSVYRRMTFGTLITVFRARIDACVAARGCYNVYWCDCLGALFCVMCV